MDAEKISVVERSRWKGVFKKPKILVLSQCFFYSKINLTCRCIKIWSQLNKHLRGSMIQGGWGACPPPPHLLPFRISSFFFFLQKRSLLTKISIKRVRNLSQNAGNGHFRDSNFAKFSWRHAPRPP